MGYPTSRVLVYDRHGESAGDMGSDEVVARVRHEEINGDHTLTIATTRVLEVGMRLLTVDGTGRWREYVVDEPDELHETGRHAIGTYKACWSLQYDLKACPGGTLWAAASEGTNDPIGASAALSVALTNSQLWRPGNCDLGTYGAASLYDGQVWDYLSKLVDVWGGEVDARIEVGREGVIGRYVDWRTALGSSTATRRFDWGSDVLSIRRIPEPGPYYCRIIPRGGSEATDADGVSYTNRTGIEDENDGVEWLQDDEAADNFKFSDGSGGWVYPTKTVCYDLETEGDAEELLQKALADLPNHTHPLVTYEASVLQLARAGMETQGVELGDAVQCVDRGFGPTPLRIEGRVIANDVNELDDTDIDLTIGQLGTTLAEEIRTLATSALGDVGGRLSRIESGGSIVYLEQLVDQLNAVINATGGWNYVVPGEGTITYDVAVSDPLVGTEASQVVQVKGGSIRLADTKKSGFAGIDDWEWRTLIVSGHVAAELVTAARITSGFIGNPEGNVYIDLDNGRLYIGPQTSINDVLDGLGDDIAAAAQVATNFLQYNQTSGALTLGATDSKASNVLTNEGNFFRMEGADVAWIAKHLLDDVWELFIEQARVTDMLRFGDFAWIARSNGNMTIKWMGA